MIGIAKFLGFSVTTVILFFLFNFALMTWQLTPISDVSKYENVKRLRWHRKDLLEHFPETIPSRIQDPRFFYRAGFLQGGASIELRMELPQREFDTIVKKNRAKAKFILNHLGKAKSGKFTGEVHFAPKSGFYTVYRAELTDEYQIGPLPDDFETFCLHIEGHFNHGESSGISVSKERREIIYWAEDW